jgi:hypothetical protein
MAASTLTCSTNVVPVSHDFSATISPSSSVSRRGCEVASSCWDYLSCTSGLSSRAVSISLEVPMFRGLSSSSAAFLSRSFWEPSSLRWILVALFGASSVYGGEAPSLGTSRPSYEALTSLGSSARIRSNFRPWFSAFDACMNYL